VIALPNPYIAGRSIDNQEGFYGRESFLRHVLHDLGDGRGKVVVISGQRRIGKTSILRNLELLLQQSGYVPVFFDLLLATGSAAETLSELGIRSLKALGVPETVVPSGKPGSDSWYKELQSLSGSRRFIFLLDEFDTLDHASPVGRGRKEYEGLLNHLQMLTSRPLEFSLIISMGQSSECLPVAARSLLKTAVSRRVRFLDHSSALALVKRGEVSEGLSFDVGVPEYIVSISGGHPFLVQLICHALWESFAGKTPVQVGDLDRIVPSIFEQWRHGFEWIWSGMTIQERAVLFAISSVESASTNREDVAQFLAEAHVRISVAEIDSAFESLVRRDLLIDADGRYQCSMEFFRRWISANMSLSEMSELRTQTPEAEARRLAESFYERGKLQGAERIVRSAFGDDPTDPDALLLLSRIASDSGRPTEAVAHAELAYKSESSKSRHTLIRLLMGEAERSKSDSEKLGHLGRLLRAVPDCEEAMVTRRSIWLKRTCDAIQKNSFRAATEHYSFAVLLGTDAECETVAAQLMTAAKLEQKRRKFSTARLIYSTLARCHPENDKYANAVRILGITETLSTTARSPRAVVGTLSVIFVVVVLTLVAPSRPKASSSMPGYTIPANTVGAGYYHAGPGQMYGSPFNYPMQFPQIQPIMIPAFTPIKLPKLTLVVRERPLTAAEIQGLRSIIPTGTRETKYASPATESGKEPTEFMDSTGNVYQLAPAGGQTCPIPPPKPEEK
jgi:hypothetical protein